MEEDEDREGEVVQRPASDPHDYRHPPHPLLRAARMGNLEMVREILRSSDGKLSADDLKGERGQHPIHAAIEGNNRDVVDLLLNAGLLDDDINVRDAQGRSPLFYAAMMGNITLVARLLSYANCDVDASTPHGWRPLHAAFGGINVGLDGSHDEVVLTLLRRGANPQKPTTNGCTPLHYAACVGLKSVVESLVLDYSVEVDAVATNSRFSSRSLPTMETAKNTNDQTPLHMALEGGHESVAIFLVTVGGAALEATDSDGRTALWMASSQGFILLLNILVDMGANVDAQMFHTREGKITKGKTPLMAAIGAARQTTGHKKAVELLLANGALMSMETENQMTALSLAVKHGYTDTCEKIFEMTNRKENGKNFWSKEQLGVLLHSAIRYRHYPVVELLLSRGADMTHRDKDGRTPLHKSVMAAHTDVVRRLVRQGVPLDDLDANGRSPLDLAVYGVGNTDLQRLTKPWVRPWTIIVVLVQGGALLNREHNLFFQSILSSRRDLDELAPGNPGIQLTDSDSAEQRQNRDREEIFCWCLESTDSCPSLKVLTRNLIRKTMGRRLGSLNKSSDLKLPEIIYQYLVLDQDKFIFSFT